MGLTLAIFKVIMSEEVVSISPISSCLKQKSLSYAGQYVEVTLMCLITSDVKEVTDVGWVMVTLNSDLL